MSPFIVKWVKFSLVALVGCGFVAMAIYAFVMRDEIRSAQIEPPLVAAPEEPVKRRPEQPGGMEVPNQDKLVFDLLDNNEQVGGGFAPLGSDATSSESMTSGRATEGRFSGGNGVESGAPAVGQGGLEGGSEVARQDAPAPAVSGGAAPAPQTPAAEVAGGGGTPAAVAAATASPKASAAAAPVESVAVAAPSPVAKVVAPAASAAKSAAVPMSSPAAPTVADKKTEAAASASASSPAGKGSWAVQLAAVGSKADADKAVARLKKDLPALKGLSARVVATPDKKKFRVQFVGLKDRAAAVTLCAKLGKQACIPVGN